MIKVEEQKKESGEKSFIDKVRDASLSASGIGFIIGDAALFAADKMNKDHTGSMTGLTYLVGAAVAARYGKENPEYHLREMNIKLKDYLKKEGVEIPKGSALSNEDLNKPKGIIDHVEKFFYTYPSQILNGMFALGGTFKVASGIKQNKYSTVAYGGLVVLAGLIGLLVPEKEPDKEHPPTSAWGKLWEKVQAAPLRTSSIIYLVNNVNLVATAISDRKEHLATGTKPGYFLTFTTACAYIIANTLLGFATKDNAKNTKDDSRYIDALETAAAEVLAQQPQEIRDKSIQRVAGYLSGQPEVKMHAKDIALAIHGKVEEQLIIISKRQNENWQTRVQDTPASLTPQPSI
jgi:hypothetical protein